MSPVYLFNIVSQHNSWLAARQATIAGNIANANTPGFKTLDVAPFEMELDKARLAMTATSAGHMSVGEVAAAQPIPVQNEDGARTGHSGNSVSLESELSKASDVSRAYKLNASIAKAFHRMLLASAKG
jgi:flagellar basal-body rod protein FlgB